jgi:DsbC/DsbD-like thiol-disulfide interchange protein
MTQGFVTDRFDRLRRTAAPLMTSLRAIVLLGASLLGTSLLGISLLGTSPALAGDDASRWDGDARSAVRLIAGAPAAGKNLPGQSLPDKGSPVRAGVEVRLKAGWHTYWRYPGDAGVPPRFDFAGSDNVKAVTVLWPAPQRIPEQGLVAIGYVRDVIWPLAIVPQNPAKPVTLRLKLDYAVCEKLCVPAEGNAELMVKDGSSADAALATALAKVPKQVALGEGSPLAIRAVRREGDGSRSRVVVDLAVPTGTDVALFAEGPAPDWALPVPMAVAGAPAGLRRFAFELDGAPPGAKYDGAAITLTAVAGEHAIEVTTHLD